MECMWRAERIIRTWLERHNYWELRVIFNKLKVPLSEKQVFQGKSVGRLNEKSWLCSGRDSGGSHWEDVK